MTVMLPEKKKSQK